MMINRFVGALVRAIAIVLLLGLVVVAPTAPAFAQDAPAAEAEAVPEPAPEEAPPAEEEAGPEFAPALTDPATEIEELELRLIPLTADQLAALAAEWLAIVQAKTEEVVEEQIRINTSGAEGAEESARERLTELTEERRALFDNYTAVVDAWELKGGDPAAVSVFRTYRGSIIVEETRNTDWRTLLAQAFEWVTDRDGGVQVAINVGIVVASFIGLLFVARIVRAIVRRWVGHVPNASKLLAAFAALIAYWLTIAVGLMVVLGALGVNITPLFALVGGASFILAFAMQNTLSNLAAGAMIMINHPFDEGDSVDIGGVEGTVKAVSLVSTTVVTPDNQVVVVPNSSVWGNVITNSTVSDTRRVDLVFSVPAAVPIAKGQAALERVVRAHPLVLDDPEPVIRANELVDGAVKFVVQPWVNRADYQTVYWDLTSQAKEAIDRLGESQDEKLDSDAPPPSTPVPQPA